MRLGRAKIWKLIVAGLVAGALGSCAPAEESGPNTPLLSGVVTTVKVLGRHFTREVTEIKDNTVVWETRLDEQLLFIRKLYLNVFEVYGREEGETFVNDVDTTAIDALFPLAVGNEITIAGVQRSSSEQGEAPLWAHMLVRDTSEVEIKGVKYDVYVIDVSLTIERGGEILSNATTYWHSPELGLNLKTRLTVEGQTYWIHVINIQSPEEAERQRKGLGTVLISAPQVFDHARPLETLYKTQFKLSGL